MSKVADALRRPSVLIETPKQWHNTKSIEIYNVIKEVSTTKSMVPFDDYDYHWLIFIIDKIPYSVERLVLLVD